MKEGTLSLGFSLCRYQFHPKPSPLGQTPGTQLERNKNLSLSGQMFVYKNPPWDKTGSQKPPPLGHKAKKITNVCIYKLFEMN